MNEFQVSRQALLWASLVSLCVATIPCGCGTGYSEDFRTEVTQEDISKLTDKTGLAIPAEAQAEGIWITRKPASTISLKLTMTGQQCDQMLRQGPIQKDDLLGINDFDPNESEQSSFPPNRLWWDPGTQQQLKVGSASLSNGGILTIGVKRVGEKKATVYVTLDEKSNEI